MLLWSPLLEVNRLLRIGSFFRLLEFPVCDCSRPSISFSFRGGCSTDTLAVHRFRREITYTRLPRRFHPLRLGHPHFRPHRSWVPFLSEVRTSTRASVQIQHDIEWFGFLAFFVYPTGCNRTCTVRRRRIAFSKTGRYTQFAFETSICLVCEGTAFACARCEFYTIVCGRRSQWFCGGRLRSTSVVDVCGRCLRSMSVIDICGLTCCLCQCQPSFSRRPHSMY